MNQLVEQFKNLNPKDPGAWPPLPKALALLGLFVATVARVVVFSIEGGFQAHMEGEIVDRATNFGIGDHPFTVESRVASSKGPLRRIQQLNYLPILTNEGVVADLVLIVGVRRSKGVDCRVQAIDRFVQHDQPGRGVDGMAKGIAPEPFAEIAGVDPHPLWCGAQLLKQGLQVLALGQILNVAAGL